MGFDENIYHVTILVDSPPEVLSLTLDSPQLFAQVPRVAQAALVVAWVAERIRFVANCDAAPPSEDIPHLGSLGRIGNRAKRHG
jgi:hypothetical protein